jgi:hypothetical protein
VNEKVDVMSGITIGLDQTEEETLTYEVSDEALKIRGAKKRETTSRLDSAPG